jgi:hypothetical protein
MPKEDSKEAKQREVDTSETRKRAHRWLFIVQHHGVSFPSPLETERILEVLIKEADPEQFIVEGQRVEWRIMLCEPEAVERLKRFGGESAIHEARRGVSQLVDESTRAPLADSRIRLSEIRECISKLENELVALTASSKPTVTLLELHDKKSGRIDAQKVADFMGVPLKQLAETLGLSYNSVHRNPSAAGYQEALRPLKRSLDLLHEFVGPVESIRAWLNTPHPDLNGATALDTILAGKADAVGLILENAWNGIPV